MVFPLFPTFSLLMIRLLGELRFGKLKPFDSPWIIIWVPQGRKLMTKIPLYLSSTLLYPAMDCYYPMISNYVSPSDLVGGPYCGE